MKTLNLNQLEKIQGGDEIDDFLGAVSCGFAIGTLFFGGVGILDWIRNNW